MTGQCSSSCYTFGITSVLFMLKKCLYKNIVRIKRRVILSSFFPSKWSKTNVKTDIKP